MAQKKKICDGLELMGEVIKNDFTFFYFRFRQLFEQALLKNQNKKNFMERSQQGMPLKIIKKSRRFSEILLHFQRHSLLTALHGKNILVLVLEQRSLE